MKSVLTVEFKEKGKSKTFLCHCYNMTKEQAIDAYGLNDEDIEWYKFIEDETL